MRSWDHLNHVLYERSWQTELIRFRSSFVFRGCLDASDDLRPSLTRLGPAAPRLETHILASFRKYAHREAPYADSVWSWLAVGQHHGLPTRLLDWTYSPYVAAHFATAELGRWEPVDGAIWCVDYLRTNRLLPARLRRALRCEGSRVFSVEGLARTAPTLERFDRLGRRPFVVFFEPPSLDQRIVNQFALFSVLSDPTLAMSTWLLRRPAVYRCIVIPAELKWEIRDKLDQANISERVLFPGLDGLAQWLERYYAHRPRHGARVLSTRSVTEDAMKRPAKRATPTTTQGISNRPTLEETEEQRELPPRGRRKAPLRDRPPTARSRPRPTRGRR